MPSFNCVSRIAPVALAVAFVASPAPPQTVQRPAVRDLARELACGPAVSLTSALPTLRIVGGKDLRRTLFAPGDPVVINGGGARGGQGGQGAFVARRAAPRA